MSYTLLEMQDRGSDRRLYIADLSDPRREDGTQETHRPGCLAAHMVARFEREIAPGSQTMILADFVSEFDTIEDVINDQEHDRVDAEIFENYQTAYLRMEEYINTGKSYDHSIFAGRKTGRQKVTFWKSFANRAASAALAAKWQAINRVSS